jgi:peroxiredoxin
MGNYIKPGASRVLLVFILSVLIISLLGILGYILNGHNFGILGPSANTPSIGFIAPDFQLINVNGNPIRLSDLRGRPVLINFWATWCGPCVIEMPILQDRFLKYSSELIILAINADEPYNDIRNFVNNNGITFDVLQDTDSKIQGLYKINGYPTSFFIDTDGIIKAIQIGGLTEDQIDKDLLTIGVGK